MVIDGREPKELRWCTRVLVRDCSDAKLHYPASGLPVGNWEVRFGDPTTEGLVRPDVAEHMLSQGDSGEVDDEVSPLRWAHQEPVVMANREVYREA